MEGSFRRRTSTFSTPWCVTTPSCPRASPCGAAALAPWASATNSPPATLVAKTPATTPPAPLGRSHAFSARTAGARPPTLTWALARAPTSCCSTRCPRRCARSAMPSRMNCTAPPSGADPSAFPQQGPDLSGWAPAGTSAQGMRPPMTAQPRLAARRQPATAAGKTRLGPTFRSGPASRGVSLHCPDFGELISPISGKGSSFVELAGIEPASSSADPGLLRVQSVLSLFSAPALAQTRRRQAQSGKSPDQPS